MFNTLNIADNPLLDIYNKALSGHASEIPGFLEDNPKYTSDPHLAFLDSHLVRRWAVRKYAWAVPSNAVIQKICQYGYEFDGLVEAHAGSGYWSHMVRLVNNNKFPVLATDINPWNGAEDNHYGRVASLFTDVEAMDAKQAAEYAARNNHALLSVWPNYGDEWTGEMIHTYLLYGGNCVLYVGEGAGGCTGDDYMHGLLEKYFSVSYADFSDVPQWEGIHDRLYVYIRNHERFDPDFKLPKEEEYI